MTISQNTTFNHHYNEVSQKPVHNIGFNVKGTEQYPIQRASEAQRFKVQRELAYHTGNKSLFNCRRYAHNQARLSSDGKKLKASGLQVCGSSLCSYCANKKIKETSEDLKLVLRWCSRMNRTSFFGTTTHSKTLHIGQNDSITRAGYVSMRKTIKSIEQDYTIKLVFFATIETTYAKPEDYKLTSTGEYVCDTHSHLHWFISFPPEVDKETRIKALKRIVKAWDRGVKSEGGHTLTKKQNVESLTENYRKAGLDIKLLDNEALDYEDLAGYLGKLISGNSDYKLSQELSNYRVKQGKGRSFLQLLDDIIIHGLEADKKAWINTVKSSYRKRRTFKNKYFKEALKEMKEQLANQAYEHALDYVNVLIGNKDIPIEERSTMIENEMRSFIMSSQGIKNDTFVPTVDIDIPKEIYNTIGFYNYTSLLLDLVVRAGRGELLKEFNLLKAFVDTNPHFNNPLYSRNHQPTIKLLKILQDIEYKMNVMKKLSYDLEVE